MKRVKGGQKVITGQIDGNTYGGPDNRIHLFDGKFTTGYRITKFIIMEDSATASYEAVAKLCTEPLSNMSHWDWGDVRELAWASYNGPTTGVGWMGDSYIIRPDNMVIEDLWLSHYSTSDSRVYNYMIVLDKYEFTAWDGAGTLVQNRSQS